MDTYPGKLTPDQIRFYLGRDPRLLIEIGANDGDDTKSFAEAFPDATIAAFEPDPRAAQAFRQSVTQGNVVLCECAVSDVEGQQTLYMSGGEPKWKGRDWDLSSSICKPTRHLTRSPEITFDETVDVQTVTLDSWWKTVAFETIDFIWCDPQGAQAKIIRGGCYALRHTRWLYIEYYDNPLYDGEPTLDEMQGLLPDWDLVATYEHENALFRNAMVE